MKGQELPISTVILIIIAVLVLVLAIYFIVLPVARAPFSAPTQGDNLTLFEHQCAAYCGLSDAIQFCKANLAYSGAVLNCYSQIPGLSGPSSFIYPNGQCMYYAANGSQLPANQVTCQNIIK
jgi:hypothetical protein